ncbi:hypothetical protein cyc_06131 [Cyclospora cayetanensis]|uniref:Uncharacterized protein n=1 Tax=Cyclospora cayetanensis TaxID=88456 RepID=A0A1D3D071_9EIME|nr:hypothetical protein cyc_06131 [Cyclospora cayetanensis]
MTSQQGRTQGFDGKEEMNAACPRWFWRSLLIWLPQPQLLDAVSASFCCMQNLPTAGLLCKNECRPRCCDAVRRTGSMPSRFLQSAQVQRTGELVHYALPEASPDSVRPGACFQCSSQATGEAKNALSSPLSAHVGSRFRRSCSPSKSIPPVRKASPMPNTRLFTSSIDSSLMKEPRTDIWYKQPEHRKPRLPAARNGNARNGTAAGTSAGSGSLEISTLFHCRNANMVNEKRENGPPAFVFSKASEQVEKTSWASKVDSSHKNGEHKACLPAVKDARARMQLLDIEAEQALPGTVPANHLIRCDGRSVPGILKNSQELIACNEFAEDNGTGSVAGDLLSATAERPQDLSPQWILRKKEPRNVEHRGYLKAGGGIPDSGVPNRLHVYLQPFTPCPANDAPSPHVQESKVDCLYCSNKSFHKDTQHCAQDLPATQQTSDPKRLTTLNVHQNSFSTVVKRLSTLSKDNLLVEDSRALGAREVVSQKFNITDEEPKPLSHGNNVHSTLESEREHILRSKMADVSHEAASVAPENAPIEKHEHLVIGNSL